MRRVFLLHLVANAVLLLLIFAWLGIRDARTFQVVLTIVLGGVLLAAIVFLHAGTWHWMRTGSWRVPRITLLRSAAAAALLLMFWWLLSLIPLDRTALWTASLLTFKSRKPVNPDSVTRVFNSFVWVLKWFVLPVVLFGQWKRPRFLLVFAGALLIGFYLPQRLIHWTPDFKTTAAEVISLLLRWGVAYVLATVAWLVTLKEAQRRFSL